MPQLTILTQHWPIAVMTVEGQLSLDQHLQMLSAWNSWFSRNEPFVALRIHRDAAALTQAPGTAKATTAWMKAGAALSIRSLVTAMIIVVPHDQIATLSKPDISKVFGVPGGIFPGVSAGLSAERLAGRITEQQFVAICSALRDKGYSAI